MRLDPEDSNSADRRVRDCVLWRSDDSKTLFIGSPDDQVPVNGGVWLAKLTNGTGPAAYSIATAWLRGGHDAVFDPETGFNRVGLPRALGHPTACDQDGSLMGRALWTVQNCRPSGTCRAPGALRDGTGGTCETLRRFMRTGFMRRNRWEGRGGAPAADQELLYYVFHVRLRGYRVAQHSDYATRHWQSPSKPWEWSDARALLNGYHYYEDLAAHLPATCGTYGHHCDGTGSAHGSDSRPTRCTRALESKLRVIEQLRHAAIMAQNETHHPGGPNNIADSVYLSIDPQLRRRFSLTRTKLSLALDTMKRLRRPRKQPVF